METLISKFSNIDNYFSPIYFSPINFLPIYWPTNHRNTKTWQINLHSIAIPASLNKFKLTQTLSLPFVSPKALIWTFCLLIVSNCKKSLTVSQRYGFCDPGSNNIFTFKLFVSLGFEIIQSAVCNRKSVFASTSIETFSSFLLSSFAVTIFVSFALLLLRFKQSQIPAW